MTLPGPRARAVAAIMVIALWAGSASGHAVLVRSVPLPRSALAQSPPRVLLWFSERLEPAYCSVAVWSAAGTRMDRGDAAVQPDDPRLLTVSLFPLAAGVYVVRYRVLSVDGHVVEASLPFTVTRGAARP